MIDTSGMLDRPTPLLEQYLDAAMETDPNLRYNKVKKVFENLLAIPSRLLPIIVDIFISVIEKPGENMPLNLLSKTGQQLLLM